MKNKFNERIYIIRTENNLSRAEFALRLNISPRLVSYWENGQRECDFNMLLRISTLFNTSIDYLLGKTEY